MLNKKRRALYTRKLKAILGVSHPVACVAAKAIVREVYPSAVVRALGDSSSPVAQAAAAALLPHLVFLDWCDGGYTSDWAFQL